MSHELVNLTLPSVVQAIEEVLEDYPEQPYQVVFSIHRFRQKLLAHILSLIPNHYGIEGEPASFKKPKNLNTSPLAERLHLETVVRGSILHILRENANWLRDHLPQHRNTDDRAPSLEFQHWSFDGAIDPALDQAK